MSGKNLTQRYQTVSANDEDTNTLLQQDSENAQANVVRQKKQTPQQSLDRKKEIIINVLKFFKRKIESAIWVAASIFVVYYSNFFKVVFTHPAINQIFLNIALVCIGIFVCLAIYSAVILPYILRVQESVDTYAPNLVYIGAFAGLIYFISITIACWPVWGWLILPMLLCLFLGFINVNEFLPNHNISSIVFGAIFFGSYFTQHYIDHDGLWH